MESKTTTKKSFSIKMDWLIKISRESMGIGKTPALVFSFENLDVLGVDRDWIAIPLSKFQEFLEDS